eukprot:451284_1
MILIYIWSILLILNVHSTNRMLLDSSRSYSDTDSDSISSDETISPSNKPSNQPTTSPSTNPTTSPSTYPSTSPSTNPSTSPSTNPSTYPTASPTECTMFTCSDGETTDFDITDPIGPLRYCIETDDDIRDIMVTKIATTCSGISCPNILNITINSDGVESSNGHLSDVNDWVGLYVNVGNDAIVEIIDFDNNNEVTDTVQIEC